MNRSLKLSMLVALALATTPALALELGQIQVKSALDRPLVADIPLQPDHPGEADQVTVSLAPDAAFARAGVNRAALKVPLSFKVVTTDAGQKVIRVTSSQPVREPYLDFLVQVSWPKGKLLREYTVLLDPLSMQSAPGATPARTPAPAPAAKPSPAPTAAAPESAPAPAPSADTAAASTAAGQADKDTYGPVAYGDTLSHIARANAIAGVSYQQMLVALKSANPDAFFHDNVNALKTGAVLRIPTRAQALSVTRQSAIAAVRSQNEVWRSRHAPTTVAGTGGSSAAVTGSGQAASSGDRLHLVSPEAGDASAGAAAGEGSSSAAELRQDLARSKEALSSQKQTAADLKSRVAALEQISDKNKRLLALKNDEIASLQQKLADARQSAGLPALPASALAPAGSTMAAAASTGTASSVANAGSAAEAPLAAAASVASAATAPVGNAAAPTDATAAGSQPAETAAVQPAPAADSQPTASSTPWYATLWARVVLGVIVLLLIIWAVLRRRRPAAAPQQRRSLADDFGDSPLGAPAAADASVDQGDDQDDTHEPFADDDGEDELLAQLAEHPDNIGLHLELASLYYSRRDGGRFEGAAEAMHAYVDDEDQPEWQDVVAMGRDLVPDHPLFLADAASTDESFGHENGAAFGDSDFLAADVDTHAPAFDADAPVAPATHEDSGHDDLDFDFSPEPTAAPEPTSEPTATGLPDESEFDALPPLPADDNDDDATILAPVAPEPPTPVADDSGIDLSDDGFSDDPVDTKLDLARAYMDMGDQEGARAMLTEAMHEGSQTQKDAAQKLLDELD